MARQTAWRWHLRNYADAIAKGLKLTGESRQLASTDNVIGGKTVKLELQVGVQ